MKTTPAQQRAIDSNAPLILCTCGPGGGKTSTTVSRIKRLIDEGADPRKICALTFTNAGARELEKRLGLLPNPNPSPTNHDEIMRNIESAFPRLAYCGTLHGFALRMLKQHGASLGYGDRIALIDNEASADLIQSKATSLGCKTKIDKLLKLKSSPPVTSAFRRSLDEIVIAGYYDDMREAGLVDFDLLLTEFLRLLKAERPALATYRSNETQGTTFEPFFNYLFVDEAQDSAEIDWRIYDALPIANKFFVADPDQAIYSFRGGRVDLMMKFSQRPDVEVIKLEENFRSHAEICDAANRLIAHNPGRIHKQTISVKGPGGWVLVNKPYLNEGEEIAAVVKWLDPGYPCDFNETAILARNNDLCYAFRTALKAAGIPVAEPPKSDLPKDWALARSLVELLAQPDNDTLAFFFLIQSFIHLGHEEKEARSNAHSTKLIAQKSGQSITQLIGGIRFVRKFSDIPSIFHDKGISFETQMKVTELIRTLPSDAGLLELALAMNQPPDEKAQGEGVYVGTLHSGKGREWDTVFLVGIEDEVLPGNRKTDGPEEERQESRRLAYVGVTRARKALFISSATQRKTAWGAIVFHQPSRFLKEITQ